MTLIRPYRASWATDFLSIREKLTSVLGDICLNIEHIGSTSVPGLAAKPIIDIDIVYNESSDFELIKLALETCGYYHNGNQEVEGREVFKRHGSQDPVLDFISHHLYVCRYDSAELQRHILFRDYLRTNPAARDYYQHLKYEIAREAGEDRKRYAAIKTVKAESFFIYIIHLSVAEHDGFSKVLC
ncbi:GrpB family protein [Dyadobacter sp. CY312]|uniref:GrpB family protein n=1 Tax=Dyadobacter sp. CY312 TaxID=2907303 RepID=UPI001F375956|nr:GrpB family protein [Dyadobacter sp. CY312]MCE7040518.1 GrpB family protein [Dyadobacter sp. CY312]